MHSHKYYRLNRREATSCYWSCNYVDALGDVYFETLLFSLNIGSSTITVSSVTKYSRNLSVVTAMPATPDENTIYFEK